MSRRPTIDRREKRKYGMAENILEVQGLTKVYPGVVALDHMNLQVRRGEIHAIMGENGARNPP